jgi:5-methylcytosine-specific restriction endonuclease McrA
MGGKAMSSYNDSLRGYSFPVHQRDKFKCRYCGIDGSKSFDAWISLSWDHLLPRGHKQWDDLDYIVTACNFCNTADNLYFEKAKERGLIFNGLTQEELVEQRKQYVQGTREKYHEFWKAKVKRSVIRVRSCILHQVNCN